MTLSATLRELAAKATPGPWRSVRSEAYASPNIRAANSEAAVLYGRSWTSARDSVSDIELVVALVNHAELLACALELAEAVESDGQGADMGGRLATARAAFRAARDGGR